MSSRPQFSPYSVITDGDMSDNITSKVTIIQKLSLISYSISWSGTTPVGTMTVEVSNDFKLNADGSVANSGTWTTVTLSAATDVSGASGTGFINVAEMAGYAIRLVYTRGSGVGTMQAVMAAKVA